MQRHAKTYKRTSGKWTAGAVSLTGVLAAGLLLFAVLAATARAADDDIPFFVGTVGAPNIMFIFDNSNSMQDIPYLKPDGNTVTPSGLRWRRGVKLNADNTVQVDASNNPVYDDDAFPTEVINPIPEQTLANLPTTEVTVPPNLPGAGSLTSSMTSYPNTSRIYDAALSWGAFPLAVTADFDANYLNRIVEVRGNDGSVQHRRITGRSTSNKYFTVDLALNYSSQPYTYTILSGGLGMATTDRLYDIGLDWTSPYLSDEATFNLHIRYRLIEVRPSIGGGTSQYRTITGRSASGKYFTFEGGPLTYSDPPYTYSILSDGPGRVTRTYSTDTKLVYDADVDWTSVNNEYSATWANRTLKVTAGTNAGLSRRIDWISAGSKYWHVDETFPVPCDHTTRYQIIGSAADERYASGGNHPASKLYQAKQAMNLFLNDPTLRSCTSEDAEGNCQGPKYHVNMGFATYLSARIPRVTANYYRLKPSSTTVDRSVITGYYKKQSDASYNFYHPNLNTTFTSTGWKTRSIGATDWISAQVHSGVTVGYQFERLYREGYCDEQILRYSVTSITLDRSEGLLNRYRFTVQSRAAQEGGYTEYSRRSFTVNNPGGATPCATLLLTNPPATDGSWTLVTSSQPCYVVPTCTYYQGETIPAYYVSEYRNREGWYEIADSNSPGYVDRVSHLVKPANGYSGTTWTEKASPDPAAGDWTLVTTDMLGVNTGWNSTTQTFTTGNILSNIYDSSYFRYPGTTLATGAEDANHLHGWSYKKTVSPWIYARFTSNVTTWSDGGQATPYFPATVGDDKGNADGYDQVVFVNLPEYNSADANLGDDVTGANVSRILGYTSLARVASPDLRSSNAVYDYTTMPYSPASLAMNSYEQTTGRGTPIAASLRDVKKYYESYVAQDPLCREGCRDNYVIFLTDGLETCVGDLDSLSPVQAATDLYNLEYSPGHNLKTYVIGFGLDTASQANLNAIAAAGGTGSAYFAQNVEALVDILVDEITSSIVEKPYSRTSSVLSSQTTGEDQRIYSAFFDFPSWKGHLVARNVDSTTGEIIGKAAAWGGDCGDDGEDDGDAGCQMQAYGRGTVYTSILSGGTLTRIVFDPDNSSTVSSLSELLNPGALLDINTNGVPGEDADAAIIMRYVLNPGYAAGIYKGTRNQDWLLGDIYHSMPVVVGLPRFNPPAGQFTGYAEFKADLDGTNEDLGIPGASTRSGRVYIGANDGMLHAFRVDNGREAWAYIPKAVLGRLSGLSDGHKFSVDLTIKAADVYSPGGLGTIWPTVGTGNEKSGWHTMLASGLRKGGRSYYAIEVTDPDNPVPVWEMIDQDADGLTRDMGYTWSAPAFGRIMIEGVNTYVVFVGGGLSSDANTGNNVYILDAANGQILKEIAVGDALNHVPSEILVVTDTDLSSTYYGNITAAYFGDTSGDLYSLTGLNDDAGGESWDPVASLLWNGEGKVFHKPAVLKSRGGCTVTIDDVEYDIAAPTNFVVYGTGDEEYPLSTTSTDRMYQIADPPLVSTDGISGTLTKVWEHLFNLTGEKMLGAPTVYLNVVYFTTFSPDGGCGTGTSQLWGITLTRCGYPGDKPGLTTSTTGDPIPENTNDDPGDDIFSIPVGDGPVTMTVGGPQGYIQEGDELKTIKLPELSKMEYWRDNY